MPVRTLKDILGDLLQAKGLTLDEVSVKTGIPHAYLQAMMQEKPERLPPFPYVRGFLVKLAEFFEVESSQLFEAFKDEYGNKSSGSKDKLPGNRFALTRRSIRFIWIGVVALVVIAYGISQSGFFGTPTLVLSTPPEGEEIYKVSEPLLVLRGSVDSDDKVFINGQAVPVSVDGSFVQEYALSPEMNIVEFKVERFLGRSIAISRNIFFEPLAPVVSSSTEEEVPPVEEEIIN